MLLTQKLLRLLNSVFDKDARAFTAFRIRHESGRLRWRIEDHVLTGSVDGVELFEVALTGYTIRTLLEHLATLPGVTVVSRVSSEQLGLSAGALMDQSGDQASSNGDQVQAFTSLLWAYLEAMAIELREARRQIDEALLQMSAKTAEAEWLDEWGGYFGITRRADEGDQAYARRIIADTLRPKGNNIAIEEAIIELLGNYDASVVDAPMAEAVSYWRADGFLRADGSKQAAVVVRQHYGQFDVVAGFDLMSPEPLDEVAARIRRAVDGFRDAGTRMRQMSIAGRIEDAAGPHSDAAALSAALQECADVRPAARLQADGSVLVGEAIPLVANGAARADGSLMASGYTVGGSPPAADADVSLLTLRGDAAEIDRMTAPAFADGATLADGRIDASGERGVALDDLVLRTTRSWRANGLHVAGEGVALAVGNARADGVHRCGDGGLQAVGARTEEWRPL